MPDAASFLPLHALELRILLAVMEAPSHGYRIVKEIEAKEGDRFRIHPANLYRRIRDLAAKGLIEEAPAPEGEQNPDRPRTFFVATELGRRVARGELSRLEELVLDARDVLEPA